MNNNNNPETNLDNANGNELVFSNPKSTKRNKKYIQNSILSTLGIDYPIYENKNVDFSFECDHLRIQESLMEHQFFHSSFYLNSKVSSALILKEMFNTSTNIPNLRIKPYIFYNINNHLKKYRKEYE